MFIYCFSQYLVYAHIRNLESFLTMTNTFYLSKNNARDEIKQTLYYFPASIKYV